MDGIADTKKRDAVLAVLKANGEAMDRLFKASDHKLRDGFELPPTGATTEGAADTSPATALRKYVEKFQADNKIPTYEQALSRAVRTDAKAGELFAAAKN